MIRKNFIAAVSLAFFILAAGTIHAGQDQGDSSLAISGSFFHAQGADVGTLNLEVGYGYFLTQNWELGVQQSLGYSFIDDGDDQWVGSTIPYVNYNFQGLSANDGFVPFVGAFVGASYNDDDITGTMGPQLGFKSFINDSTFILVKYRYEWFFDELTINDIEDTSSDGNHVVTIGLGFVF
ncbi:MAG: hypothetical protein RBR67_02290 [Desulfobacterium sp.]|jgi:hypothetical protein|nr:hypothetical protein [Desulfobacterium sp.]